MHPFSPAWMGGRSPSRSRQPLPSSLQGGNDPDAGGVLRRRRCPLSRRSTRMMRTQAGVPVTSYKMKPLGCDPQHVKGMSERLIISHYDNNYGGAVKRLNLITEQLAGLD